jgi:hexokinase
MLLKSLFGPSFWIDPGDFRAKTPNDKKEAVVIGSLLHLIMGRGAFLVVVLVVVLLAFSPSSLFS